MMRRWLAILALAALSACATPRAGERSAAPVEVKIIAFNDFHGALEPPQVDVPAAGPDGRTVQVPAGGAAYFASAVARLQAANPNHIVVAAGDLIMAMLVIPIVNNFQNPDPARTQWLPLAVIGVFVFRDAASSKTSSATIGGTGANQANVFSGQGAYGIACIGTVQATCPSGGNSFSANATDISPVCPNTCVK